MTDDHIENLNPFDRLVSSLWAQQGYDVVPGDDVDLVAYNAGETKLLETYPEGGLTAADVDDAVAKLISSADANHVTLVVGGEVPSSLREETDEWAVSIVGEPALRDMAEHQDVDAILGGEGTRSLDQPEREPPGESLTDAPATLEVETPDESPDAVPDQPVPEPEDDPVTEPGPPEGASDDRVEETVQQHERRTLTGEFGALAFEVLLALLLVATLVYLAVQVAAVV